jgi:hypothetical protein
VSSPLLLDLCILISIHPGLNIGAHKEAAEHFLSAITMQEASGSETSEQLWSTLRRAFLAMVWIFNSGLRYTLPDLSFFSSRTDLI